MAEQTSTKATRSRASTRHRSPSSQNSPPSVTHTHALLPKPDKAWANRNILAGRTFKLQDLHSNGWDLKFFISAQHWQKIVEDEGVVYPSLVREFYENMHFSEGLDELISTVGGVKIVLTEATLSHVLDLPSKGNRIFGPDWVIGLNLSHAQVKSDLLTDISTSLSESKGLKPISKFLHTVCIHTLAPRVGSSHKVNPIDQILIYHLFKQIPLNFSFIMMRYMHQISKSRATVSLPYGSLMTKVFQHFHVPLTGLATTSEHSIYSSATCNQVGIPKFSGLISVSPKKAKKQMDAARVSDEKVLEPAPQVSKTETSKIQLSEHQHSDTLILVSDPVHSSDPQISEAASTPPASPAPIIKIKPSLKRHRSSAEKLASKKHKTRHHKKHKSTKSKSPSPLTISDLVHQSPHHSPSKYHTPPASPSKTKPTTPPLIISSDLGSSPPHILTPPTSPPQAATQGELSFQGLLSSATLQHFSPFDASKFGDFSSPFVDKLNTKAAQALPFGSTFTTKNPPSTSAPTTDHQKVASCTHCAASLDLTFKMHSELLEVRRENCKLLQLADTLQQNQQILQREIRAWAHRFDVFQHVCLTQVFPKVCPNQSIATLGPIDPVPDVVFEVPLPCAMLPLRRSRSV